MARIAYGLCNVATGDGSTSDRRSDSEPAPQETIPRLRFRLTIDEAKALADDLARAAAAAASMEVAQ